MCDTTATRIERILLASRILPSVRGDETGAIINHLSITKCLQDCISRQRLNVIRRKKANSYKCPQEERSDHNQQLES